MIAAISAPPAATPVVRDYISFSAIRTYQQCPLRYFFKYMAGLPEETVSASLVFGAAIHKAIEHHFRELMAGAEKPDLDSLMETYRQGWDERDGVPVRFGREANRESLDKLAERMLAAFASSPHAVPQGRILGVEEELRGELLPGLPDLLARIDLIRETPNELVISDWKTSRSRWNQDQVDESAEQLLLYAALARPIAPGKDIRLEFVVATKTKEVSIDRHLKSVDGSQMARSKQAVQRVWRSIQAGNFYPAPTAMNCASCPYREPCRKWPG